MVYSTMFFNIQDPLRNHKRIIKRLNLPFLLKLSNPKLTLISILNPYLIKFSILYSLTFSAIEEILKWILRLFLFLLLTHIIIFSYKPYILCFNCTCEEVYNLHKSHYFDFCSSHNLQKLIINNMAAPHFFNEYLTNHWFSFGMTGIVNVSINRRHWY